MTQTVARHLVSSLALAIGFAALAVLGLNWATVQGVASPVFPAAGLAVAALALGGIRLWPGVLLGTLAAYLLAGATTPLWTQVLLASGNALGASLAAWGLARAAFNPDLTRVRDAMALIVFGAGGMSAVAASVGALGLWIAVPLDAPRALLTWSNWFFGDVVGILTVAPLVFAWRGGFPVRSARWWGHFVLCLAATALVAVVVFARDFPIDGLPLAWVGLVPLLWAAFAFRAYASLMLVLLATIAVSGTTLGLGTFGGVDDVPARIVVLQMFVSVASALVLVVVGLISELDDTQALRASQERFRSLVSATSQVVWTASANGAISEDSPSWRALTGQSHEAWMANGWGERIHSDDLPRALAAWQAALAGVQLFDCELRVRRADGAYRWMQARAAPVRNEDGTVREWVGAIADISERKRAEEVLRYSEAEFRAMANAAPAMTWLTSPTHQTTFISDSLQAMTGLTLEECADYGWSSALYPDDRDDVARRVRQAHQLRERFAIEYRIRDRQGRYHWVLDTGVPRFAGSGEFLGYVGNILVIHDRKLAEQALRDADRRKDEFLATLAHELRNPLAPLRTGLEILRRTALGSAAATAARDMMERQVLQMVRLVDDLLDLSRISVGKVVLKPEDVELGTVLQVSLEAARPLAEAAHHRLLVQASPESLWVHGDAARLSQALSNLLNNACKYTPEPGTIEVRLTAEEGVAVIRVSDSGVGLTPEAIPKVFEIFTQVGKGIDRSQGGLGIGLALARQLVELHGGTVDAASAGPGQGSTFTIRLPLVPAPSGQVSRRTRAAST